MTEFTAGLFHSFCKWPFLLLLPPQVNKYREKGCNNCEISVGRLACTTVSQICTVSSRLHRGRRRQPSSSPLPHRFTPTWWPVAARPLSFRSQPDARCIVARIPKCYVLFHFQLLAGPQEWLGNLLSRWTGPRDRIIAIDPVRQMTSDLLSRGSLPPRLIREKWNLIYRGLKVLFN